MMRHVMWSSAADGAVVIALYVIIVTVLQSFTTSPSWNNYLSNETGVSGHHPSPIRRSTNDASNRQSSDGELCSLLITRLHVENVRVRTNGRAVQVLREPQKPSLPGQHLQRGNEIKDTTHQNEPTMKAAAAVVDVISMMLNHQTCKTCMGSSMQSKGLLGLLEEEGILEMHSAWVS